MQIKDTSNNAPKNLSLSKLLDIPVFQGLSDSFTKLTGLPTAILDLEGNILIANGWQKICTDFHRKHSVTASRCLESDTRLASQLAHGQKYHIYECKNGLIDVAAPIFIENLHIGNLFVGQFLFEKPDLDFFTRQAQAFGFDKAQYLDALDSVPVLLKPDLENALEHLTNLTIVIGSAGLDKKRLLEINKNLEEQIHVRTMSLKKTKQFSESLISSLPGVMYVFNQLGHFKSWNQNYEKVTGYSKNEILKMNPLDVIATEDKQRVREAINQVFQEGQATVEARFSTISGETIPYLFTGFKYTQEDVNHVIGVGIDISDRVKAETEKANLIKKLQEALAEVKQLSGLLPICASCKKIRDDKGYWNQIESYIKKHSEAEFSHCMCPDCSKMYYGHQDWYKKWKKDPNSE